jgi:hypothetical protein
VGGLEELASNGGGGSTATATDTDTATATDNATDTATVSISGVGAGSADLNEAKHDTSASAALAAAGEAAGGTTSDVGAYAFALVEKVLRSSPDAYRFSEVVGWEKAVLAPLHTAHVRNAPVVDQHPALGADQDVGPELLKRQYHPRISAAVSMLHAVLWERFKTVSVRGHRCASCLWEHAWLLVCLCVWLHA